MDIFFPERYSPFKNNSFNEVLEVKRSDFGNRLPKLGLKTYLLCLYSSDTVSFFLPFALLEAKTFLPAKVDMRSLKPCLFLLFLFEG